ncbi:MAG TPA: DUF434 domain-containing protein [Blastocatellia bacterium]|nr:DUF434 domain-containing protein [Blastocatellia bacterium]
MSPDRRKHRGAHGEDGALFGPEQLAILREATADLSWLLSRQYSQNSSLKVVGDRYGLRDRQRLAVSRAACSDSQLEARPRSRVEVSNLAGSPVVIDGFNLLITIEAALSGGVLIIGRDGCVRDLSSVHGSYRSVEETEAALELAGLALRGAGVSSATWVLDKPVSNSGRLATRIRDYASSSGFAWEVELAMNPDRELIAADQIVVSSDSVVLDHAARWTNLAFHIVENYVPDRWMLDFRRTPPAETQTGLRQV